MHNHFNPDEEKDFLNSLVINYRDVLPYSRIKKDIIIDLIDQTIDYDKKNRALQFGCSNGYETEQLSKRFNHLDVIDGSSVFIEKLAKEKKYQNVNFIWSLFEEYKVVNENLKYDYIFCNYILEHVYDPTFILMQIKKILKPNGILIIVVPNENALSRRIALKMGLLNSLDDLTENDLRHGHRRVYNRDMIEKDLFLSGFSIVSIKGIVFKILADFQLNKLLNEGFLSDEHIFALQELASVDKNIEFSDSFFIVAKVVNGEKLKLNA